MNGIKPHYFKWLLTKRLGMNTKQIKSEIEKNTAFRISTEQLDKYLSSEDEIPWRIHYYLNQLALIQLEGWDELQCEEDEVVDRLIPHIKDILEDKKKIIEDNQRVEDCFKEYDSIMWVD
jgi:hypothetical protein